MPERMAAALEQIHVEDPPIASAVIKSEKIDWKHIALAIIFTLVIMALTATVIWLVTNDKEVKLTRGKSARDPCVWNCQDLKAASVPPFVILTPEKTEGSGEGGIASRTEIETEGSGAQSLSPADATGKKEIPRFISFLLDTSKTSVGESTFMRQVPQMEEVEGSIETSGNHHQSFVNE